MYIYRERERERERPDESAHVHQMSARRSRQSDIRNAKHGLVC